MADDRRDLRALIRERRKSGVLPAQYPEHAGPGSLVPEIRIGTMKDAACLVCSASGPHISYTYRDGRIVRLHAACDTAWRLSNESGGRRRGSDPR